MVSPVDLAAKQAAGRLGNGLVGGLLQMKEAESSQQEQFKSGAKWALASTKSGVKWALASTKSGARFLAPKAMAGARFLAPKALTGARVLAPIALEALSPRYPVASELGRRGLRLLEARTNKDKAGELASAQQQDDLARQQQQVQDDPVENYLGRELPKEQMNWNR
jgi:hypothetical protein